VRLYLPLFAIALAAAQAPPPPFQELSHASQVLGGQRTYRVFLPSGYNSGTKRYPVVYWLHGYESSGEQDRYFAEIAAYVAQHDLIVVDTGPVETVGEFPLYLPELADHIDRTLRTVPDRDHRAVTGYSAGGFMAFWLAGKFPDLFSSASSFMGPTEYTVGPKGFDVESNFDDFYANYDGMRTRLVTGTRDFIRFYHARLNAIWSYARAGHETEEFDSAQGTPGLAKTLDFHLNAFANPLSKPAVFSHADVYPNFSVWGWEVISNRRRPGVTALDNVSRSGFRSAVREWIPGGADIAEVKLSISSPPRLYAPGSVHSVSYIRLRDGNVRRANLKADAEGRLVFDLDGEATEVGVGPEALLAVSGYRVANGAWATAGQPVQVRVRFLNKGAVRPATETIQWESPNPGVKLEPASSRLFAMMPGESAELPLTVTVEDPARAVVKIVAATEGSAMRLGFEIPLFPPAQASQDFRIADGRVWDVYQHAVQHGETALGDGNGDAHAAPGESFAILFPDGPAWRAAELFTNDPCIDNTVRISDSWSDYDHTGASVKYSLPRILPSCQPGTVLHFLARVVQPDAPDHKVRYWSVELPVWYREPEAAPAK
jgi:pimeloyl-ACP methyl ester carboxylesterase